MISTALGYALLLALATLSVGIVSGNLGTHDVIHDQVLVGQHTLSPTAFPIAAALGEREQGTLLSEGDDGVAALFAKEILDLGDGDGTVTDFGGALAGPLEPGSVTVYLDDAVALRDDGAGNLYGAGGAGTVNYGTGAVAVSFDAAPAAAVDVTTTGYPRLLGVLARRTDAAAEGVAPVILHGTVKRLALLEGAAAPADEALRLLRLRGIYAV